MVLIETIPWNLPQSYGKEKRGVEGATPHTPALKTARREIPLQFYLNMECG